MVKYPKHADSALMTKVKEVCQYISQDTVFSVPDELVIELMQTAAAGASGHAGYHDLMAYCDAEIAKSYIGAALAVNESQGTGTYAQSKEHGSTNDIFYSKVKTDLEESIWFEQIIRPLLELNSTLPVEMMPRLTFNPLQEADMARIAETMKLLIEAKVVAPGEAWIRERLQIPAHEAGTDDPGLDGGDGDDMDEEPMQEFPVDADEVPSEEFRLLRRARAHAVAILPDGHDQPLVPAGAGPVPITDADQARALDEWDRAMPGFAGLLDARVIGRSDF